MEVKRDPAFVPALLLVTLFAIAMVVMYQVPDWDYLCNINAGELLRQGRDPYSHELGTRYIYPPPYAHLLRVALDILPAPAIFWLFQSVQALLVVAAFLLLRELARRFGANATTATIIAAAVTVVNFPLFYTVRHHQVNLLMLDSALLAMLFPRRAALTGLALAAGTTMKLYPAVLLLPLWVFGYRRIAAWWLAGMAAPLVFTGIRRDWVTFLELLPDMPKGQAILDNSVMSLIERGMQAAGATPSIAMVEAAAGIVGLAVLLVAVRRLVRHYIEGSGADSLPFLRAMAEWSAIVLFLSPIAWEMHFVVALPLAVILIVERPRHAAVVAGCALMLLVPRTPHYPFSHHYLAGLAALFAASGTRRRV